jgi:hypothetical protein
MNVRQRAADHDAITHLRDLVEAGALAMRVSTVLPAAQAVQAHRLLDAGGLCGRIILEFPGRCPGNPGDRDRMSAIDGSLAVRADNLGGRQGGARTTLPLASGGFFLITLDILIVNVALTRIGRDLGGGTTALQGAPPRPGTREGSTGTALQPARPDHTPATGSSAKPLPGLAATLRPWPRNPTSQAP